MIPCARCGAQVARMSIEENPGPVPGWRVVTVPEDLPRADVHLIPDADEGTGLYEGEWNWDQKSGHPPMIACNWTEHTQDRCQRARGE